ncbi:MAG: acyltransferase family protein [Solirubrobacteraceae bacterium]
MTTAPPFHQTATEGAAAPVRSGAADRILFLDAVRGIAASLVVVERLLDQTLHGPWPFVVRYTDPGRIGVVAFFLVSGYVIPLSLAGQTVKTFGVRRVLRLYPAYWAAFSIWILAFPSVLNGQSGLTVALNVVLLQGLLTANAILPPAWTLGIELAFYTQSALARLRSQLDRAVSLGWLWLTLYFAFCALERLTGHDLPRTVPLLLFAASLGHSLSLRDTRGSRVHRKLFAAGIVVVPLGTAIGHDAQWNAVDYALSFGLGVALFLAFYIARRRRTNPVLLSVGAISYPVYLFHVPVVKLLEAHAGLDGLALVAASIPAIALVSLLVHRTIELPGIALGRRLTPRPRDTMTAAVADHAAP